MREPRTHKKLLNRLLSASVLALLAGSVGTFAHRVGAEQQPATLAQLASAGLLVVEAPPSNYFLSPTVRPQPNTALQLVKTYERPNNITDDERWWSENRFDADDYRLVRDRVAAYIPPTFAGTALTGVIRANSTIALYDRSRYLVLLDPVTGQPERAFDFARYRWPQSFAPGERESVAMSVNWAQVVDGTLYVSYGHRTYAASSQGLNAYLAAIDAVSGKLLWHSEPLVSNARNFLVVGDAIVSGYGFTAEADYIYILNKGDGRVVSRVPTKTAVSYLALRDGQLFVRAYDTDYRYELRQAPVK